MTGLAGERGEIHHVKDRMFGRVGGRDSKVERGMAGLPTSHIMMAGRDEDFTSRIFEALNGMLLDMLAAIARKDYDDRRHRQAQGIAKAKTEGRYRGRPEGTGRNAAIQKMLKAGQSGNSIIAATGASRSTLARLAKREGGA